MIYRRIIALFIWLASAAANAAPGVADFTSSNLPIVTIDTGGKATSDTVKKSFELILRDKRLKVIFVNIFGGITDCGMIADGVLLAFKEVDIRGVPVVVRL